MASTASSGITDEDDPAGEDNELVCPPPNPPVILSTDSCGSKSLAALEILFNRPWRIRKNLVFVRIS